MNKTTLLTIAVITAIFTSYTALATTGDSSSTALKSSKKIVAAKGTINVISATYGGNCTKKSVKGNVTSHLKLKCDGKTNCDYKVEVNSIGDPFYGCAKTYVAEYSCGDKKLTVDLPAEASFQTKPLTLSCQTSAKGITESTKPDTQAGQ